MSKHEILFSITEDARDGINFQVKGSEVNFIVNKKEDVLAVMDRLRNALVNETYPFKPISKGEK